MKRGSRRENVSEREEDKEESEPQFRGELSVRDVFDLIECQVQDPAKQSA
jgi:hypothetical protein